jgi:hypothetical protein
MRPVHYALQTLLFCLPLQATALPPFADIHVHYKWNQEELISAEEVVQILLENNTVLALVIGTPAEQALKLEQLVPQRILPVWSPYQAPGDWSTWAFDKTVLERAHNALASGHWHGIGELHLISGFTPAWDTPVISGLMTLAMEHDVPVLLHTEYSRTQQLEALCRSHTGLKIIWAHAGAILTPGQVGDVMATCPGVWAELSARDPWRYINNPVTGEDGRLLPEWRRLVERYPDRFLVGSDPVWPVERLDSWDEADSGWQQYGRFVEFHRTWLSALPPELEEKLRLTNALRLFGKDMDPDAGTGSGPVNLSTPP